MASCTCGSTSGERRDAGGLVAVHAQNDKALAGADGSGRPPAGREKVAFSSTSPSLPRWKSPRSPPAEAVGPPEEDLARSAKFAPALSLAASCVAVACAAAICASVALSAVVTRISLRCTCSGTSKSFAWAVVVGLLLLVGEVEVAADLVAHDLLGDDLVLDLLLEVLKGDTLLSAAFSRASMESRWFCLRMSSRRRMVSASPVMSSSLPLESRSCWSIMSRSRFWRVVFELGRLRHPAAGPRRGAALRRAGTRCG